jgi:hypothetical protein
MLTIETISLQDTFSGGVFLISIICDVFVSKKILFVMSTRRIGHGHAVDFLAHIFRTTHELPLSCMAEALKRQI